MISVSYQVTHFNPWENLTIKTKYRLGFYLERTLAYSKEEPDSQTSSFSHFITYLIRHYSYGKENALTPLVKMEKRGKENNIISKLIYQNFVSIQGTEASSLLDIQHRKNYL